MTTPVIVSLHYMVDPILSEPLDKILYLIRQFIYNPGFITTEYKEFELSFRGIATRFPYDPQKVVSMINDKLGEAIKRVVPEFNLVTTVDYELQDENNYKLVLGVLDEGGNPFIPEVTVNVIDNELNVKYKTA